MNAPAPAPAPPAPRRRRLLRNLVGAAAALLVGIAAATAIGGWLVGSTSGMNAIIAVTNRFTPVRIEASGAQGALNREFGFAEIRVTVDDVQVDAREFSAQLVGWQLLPLRFDFDTLQASRLRIDVPPSKEPTPPVRDIGIPVELTAVRLAVGELIVATGTELALREIETKAAAGAWGYRADDGHLAFGRHKIDVSAQLGSTRPFALQGRAAVAAQLAGKPIDARLQTSGSLQDLLVAGELAGAGGNGRFEARIGAFDKPAIKSLALDLAAVDPHAWHASAPRADLLVKAQLAPSAAFDRVRGSVQAVNRAPGTLDEDRIPARSARAQIDIDGEQLRIEQLAGELSQGTVHGEFTLQYAGAEWQARAQFSGVDPARLHGRLKPLLVDGTMRAKRSAGTISVLADLASRTRPSGRLQLDAQFTANETTIRSAQLSLGEGSATAAGTIGLTAPQRIQLKGELARFEPGLLIRDIDARISGSFSADAALAPQPNGRLRFELADSRAWGRPLAGRGRIELDAAQRLDIDVELDVRSARLAAKGGLGAADRTLAFSAEVPALAELLPADFKDLAGAFSLTGTARGAWNAPAVQAALTAAELRYGNHTLQGAQAEIDYGGGADAALRLHAGFARYDFKPQPNATIRAATLAVDGRLSAHGIRIRGETELAKGASFYAEGGWRDGAWRGLLREATIGAPLELRLLAPANLLLGPATEFGPAQLALRETRLEDIRFAASRTQTTTSGRFSGLQPMQMVAPVEGAITPVVAASGTREPLTLRGNWDLRFAQQVDGKVLIERSGGDLYAGRGPDSALKLVDVRFEADVQANQLSALARIESEKSGGLGASIEASLERSEEAGWRLAQTRPWLILGALDLPTMDWVNALLSDHIRANVRLGGKLASSVRIEGTPGQPSASGQMTGEALRVAWVEQGVRLDKGRLSAHLQDDLIVVDELNFSGPPRIRPDDKRAAAAVRSDEPGSISASGQLRLRDFSGVIQVAASQLPILQRPDRWIVASGGANIETSARHVQFNGAVAAVAGYVDFSRSELPSPSSDVLVVRSREQLATRAPRVSFGFDLGIDLGEAFYLRGSGLDTRVQGAVRLRSAGRGVVTAVGSIAAEDGSYEGFGQKLKIARGRVNFQGAPENPGLDILALRTGLPVTVGVTITRTAADPLVRLHSDPPMTDVEAISWLVLGRPADQTRGENVMLVQAAAGLLAGRGEAYSTRVARAIGIDELAIRSGQIGAASLLPNRSVAGALRSDEASPATVAGEIITIGKRLSDALTLSFEQAISGTSRIVQLNYRLSDKLSLVARGGTENALDLVYTFAWD